MSLPLFVETAIPTLLEIDLGHLCPPHDRYRIFSEKIFPRLVSCRAVLEEDEAYCLDQGRAGIEPVWLLGVCLLQFMERVSDRRALWLLTYHAGWSLALRRPLTEPVFHPTVLVYFRQRLLKHKQSDRLFQEILQGLVESGFVSRRSAQRLDSTQMWGVIRQTNRLDCVRESLRLAREEIEGPAGVSARPVFGEELWDRYGEDRVDYKMGAAERKRQWVQAGQDGLRLVSWAQGLTEATVSQGAQRQLLARVLDEQFEQKPAGVEARTELASDRVQNPHEPEAHYAAKGQGQQKKEHIGYRVQVAETAQEQALAPGQPTGQFLTDIVTQFAEQSDEVGAEQVAEHHTVLQARRQEQKMPAFQQRYQNRAGIEGTISELKRGHGLGGYAE